MTSADLPAEAASCLQRLGKSDIVIGVPSYNNGRTIAHVVRAAHAGLSKYYGQYTSVIINSDGGSTDDTREKVLGTAVEDSHLLMLRTPLSPVHRLSLPYHGIPGKGSAFRLVFRMAEALNAKACAVIDSDLRSITPEWIDLLLRPVLHASYDFVAPYYHRHKYDGTITNSIVYPLTRSLYGQRVRQPIGGDFGLSGRLVRRYLARDDWETDVARFGIDIWLTTIALAEGYRVCQSFLGAKLHDAKDPGADLTAMLNQVTGSVFQLLPEYRHVWQSIAGSRPVDLFGFRYDVGLEPVAVNVQRMIAAFLQGCENLEEVWNLALGEDQLRAWSELGKRHQGNGAVFHVEDELWVRTIHDFACAWREHRIERGHILRSLTPLYLARVASFVLDTVEDDGPRVEDKIENLCLCFERLKPELVAAWSGRRIARGKVTDEARAPEPQAHVEVKQ